MAESYQTIHELDDLSINKDTFLVGSKNQTTGRFTVESLKNFITTYDAEAGKVFVTDTEFGTADPTGVEDSTPAFQAAIDYCRNNNIAALIIPSGVYKLVLPSGATTVLKDIPVGLSLIGYGAKYTKLLFSGTTTNEDLITYRFYTGSLYRQARTYIEGIGFDLDGCNARRGIVTPESSTLFAYNPRYYIDVDFATTDDVSSKSPNYCLTYIYIGDCIGGRVGGFVQGGYDITSAHAGQPNCIGLSIGGASGNIGLFIEGFNGRHLSSYGELRQGVEGFYWGAGSEAVACYDGITGQYVTAEPGGIFSGLHLNVNHYGFNLKNCVGMKISDSYVYRTNGWHDHTDDWVALKSDNCMLQIDNFETVADAGGAGIYQNKHFGIKASNGSKIFATNFNNRVSNGDAGNTAAYMNACGDCFYSGVNVQNTPIIFEAENQTGNIIINGVTLDGPHTNTTTYFKSSGTTSPSVWQVGENSIANLTNRYATVSVSSAGTALLKWPIDATVRKYTFSGTNYTYNIDLDKVNQVEGTVFRLSVQTPNPWGVSTLNIRNGTGGAVIDTLTGDDKNVNGEYMFDGTNWVVFKPFETSTLGLRSGGGAELTLDGSGAVTVTHQFHRIDTEANAATDTCLTINGGEIGAIVTFALASSGRVVTFSNSGGNILMGDGTSDVPTNANYTISFIKVGETAYRRFNDV